MLITLSCHTINLFFFNLAFLGLIRASLPDALRVRNDYNILSLREQTEVFKAACRRQAIAFVLGLLRAPLRTLSPNSLQIEYKTR